MDETIRLIRDALAAVGKLQQQTADLEQSEWHESLVGLRDHLQQLSTRVEENAAERSRLKDRIASLEQSLSFQPQMIRHKGVYWVEGDPDPWCPRCWEQDHVALHLNRTELLAGRLCACPKCAYNINLDNTTPPPDWIE